MLLRCTAKQQNVSLTEDDQKSNDVDQCLITAVEASASQILAGGSHTERFTLAVSAMIQYHLVADR